MECYIFTIDTGISHHSAFIHKTWLVQYEAGVAIASRYITGGRPRRAVLLRPKASIGEGFPLSAGDHARIGKLESRGK